MQDPNEYKTLASSVEGLYKEKGSKFIGFAFPCTSEDEFQGQLNELKNKHNSARHHCYAYAFGASGESYRENDDGEPSGTAGRPIHGQIRSFNLTNIGVVVVRYFGGTKLGASGLVRAYREAAKAALEHGKVITVDLKDQLSISFPPDQVGAVMRLVERHSAKMIGQSFTHESVLALEVPARSTPALVNALKAIPKVNFLEECD